MPSSYTPLRYPGGKGRLANFMKLLFLRNGLCDGHYVEPFAGGAGLAITLLRHEFVSVVHLNDIDLSVYSFWKAVLEEADALCDRVRRVPVTMREWNKQRAIYLNPTQHSTLDLGFAALFLNRCNRSGILGGGVIGGKRQTGKWKIDARFNRETLVSRIEAISRFRGRIRLYKKDAADFLREAPWAGYGKALIYLDPPYYKRGCELYENHYEPSDHEGLAELLSADVSSPWIVSYDNCSEIQSIYGGCRGISYEIGYSANVHREGRELMFFSDNLDCPRVTSPLRVSHREVKVAFQKSDAGQYVPSTRGTHC